MSLSYNDLTLLRYIQETADDPLKQNSPAFSEK